MRAAPKGGTQRSHVTTALRTTTLKIEEDQHHI